MVSKQIERTFQKNRFFNKPKKIKLKLGDSALISLKESRIELSILGRMKRFLKKLMSKRYLNVHYKREKIWYFGKTYYFLQKKSKNSRMGKGKGSIDRKVLKLKKNFILFEFCGMSYYKLNWFVNKINKKLNFKFRIFSKKITLNSTWFCRKNYNFFYKKYLID